jgi:hypothetical protein
VFGDGASKTSGVLRSNIGRSQPLVVAFSHSLLCKGQNYQVKFHNGVDAGIKGKEQQNVFLIQHPCGT